MGKIKLRKKIWSCGIVMGAVVSLVPGSLTFAQNTETAGTDTQILATKVTGWKSISGKWYYYGTDGVKCTGWRYISGKWYYFGADGVMQTGWKKIGGKWYYLAGSGAMQTDWKKIGGKWYYFNSSGVMQTGWQKISGKWYFLNSSGAMQTGWLKNGGEWYYLLSSGAMVTGSKVIRGVRYTFENTGVMISEKKNQENLERYKKVLDKIYRCAELEQKIKNDPSHARLYEDGLKNVGNEIQKFLPDFQYSKCSFGMTYEFRDITGNGKDELVIFRDSHYLDIVISESAGTYTELWDAALSVGAYEMESGDYCMYSEGAETYWKMTENGIAPYLTYWYDPDEEDESIHKVTFTANEEVKEVVISRAAYEKELAKMSPQKKQEAKPLSEYK